MTTTPIDSPTMVSVVIPARNVAELLPFQLESLSGQTYRGRWEVVIADNCSTDRTVDIALNWTEKLPDLRVVRAHRRRGVNHARNVGAAAARGDLLLFCDADDVASAGWLQAMAEAARSSDIVGGVINDRALSDFRARSWRPRPLRDYLPVHSTSFLTRLARTSASVPRFGEHSVDSTRPIRAAATRWSSARALSSTRTQSPSYRTP